MVHGERTGFLGIGRESANFEAKPLHCGFEIARNQKLILNDEGTIAAFVLNVIIVSAPGSTYENNAVS
jgi:hypothetical protein